MGKSQEIFREDGHYVFSIPLPLVDKEQVQLHRSVFDELIVRIGNWKHNITLPLGLAKLDIDGARYDEDRLNIYFATSNGEELPAEVLSTDRWETLRTRFNGDEA